MEIEENNTDNIQEARPNVGVRVPAKTKQELIREASKLGISISEYVECLLLSRHNNENEIEDLKS